MNINPASSDLFDYSKLHKSLQDIQEVSKNTKKLAEEISYQENINNSINHKIEQEEKVFKISSQQLRSYIQEVNKIPFPMLLTTDRLNINKEY